MVFVPIHVVIKYCGLCRPYGSRKKLNDFEINEVGPGLILLEILLTILPAICWIISNICWIINVAILLAIFLINNIDGYIPDNITGKIADSAILLPILPAILIQILYEINGWFQSYQRSSALHASSIKNLTKILEYIFSEKKKWS